jgi:hypothetical protein
VIGAAAVGSGWSAAWSTVTVGAVVSMDTACAPVALTLPAASVAKNDATWFPSPATTTAAADSGTVVRVPLSIQ